MLYDFSLHHKIGKLVPEYLHAVSSVTWVEHLTRLIKSQISNKQENKIEAEYLSLLTINSCASELEFLQCRVLSAHFLSLITVLCPWENGTQNRTFPLTPLVVSFSPTPDSSLSSLPLHPSTLVVTAYFSCWQSGFYSFT